MTTYEILLLLDPEQAEARQDEILAEAVKINDRLRRQVREKRARLDEVMAELDAKARRYRDLARRSRTPG